MKLFNALALLSLLAMMAKADEAPDEEQMPPCGPLGGDITIAGSSTVLPVAERWAQAYMEMCPGLTVYAEGGGSSVGAGRVCNNTDSGAAVDIGSMSRDWKTSEANQDGYTFQCLMGDTNRQAIQVDVAIDGLSVVTQLGGASDTCIQSLGGLTIDQLRWIFSSYNEAELTATGWNATALPNSDGDDSTHLWSELRADCPAVEIKIAGHDDLSGTYEYMSETIFADLDNGEIFDAARPDGYFASADDNEIVAYLQDNEDAIAYTGFAYYQENTGTLNAAAIENGDGLKVLPNPDSVGDGSYNPLARRIFMNIYDDVESLRDTIPFIRFGLTTEEGSALVAETGYVPIPDADKLEMIARLNMCPPGGDILIAGSSTVQPVAELWAEHYMEMCPTTTIVVEGGGSSNGAGRVCGEESRGEPVEIGNMSREWKDSEANDAGNGVFECLVGNTTRSAIQIEVAIDGLSVVTKLGGAGDSCTQSLGGLTIDQLRWIFSSYTEAELTATGWDAAALSNSDGDDATHLWSELSSDCPTVEIKIAGHDDQSGSYEYMSETIFADLDNGEIFDAARPDGYFATSDDAAIITFLEDNGDAIAYTGYAYYSENQDTINAAAIENGDGDFVAPSTEAVGDGTYNPLSRRIYMNLYNDPETLALTWPFIEFGLGPKGSELVSETGYVPVPSPDLAVMASRFSE